jgi:hypothetical protein
MGILDLAQARSRAEDRQIAEARACIHRARRRLAHAMENPQLSMAADVRIVGRILKKRLDSWTFQIPQTT